MSTSAAAPAPPGAPDGLVHDALFYADDDAYVAGVGGYVREGLELGEPVLVAVPGWNLDLLRGHLDTGEVRAVRFADMTSAGRNPGRIIGTVLRAFVAEHPGRRVRIVGEPVWPGRTDDEYPACAEHEALINVALADDPATVLCPYDTARLAPSAVHDATRTHPTLGTGPDRWPSPSYADPAAVAASFDRALPEPPDDAGLLLLGRGNGPAEARRFVHDAAADAGMAPERIASLHDAVQEVVVNTFVHAGGRGLLRVWTADGALVCQVEDGGRVTDPLAGRRLRGPSAAARGLFRVHEVCDLVRMHRGADGTAVRFHLRLR